MKYLLHIDTSADMGVVALAGDGKVLAKAENDEKRDHGSALNGMISQVVAEAGIKIGDITAIVVCGGPGSYTGLRIGLATGKGLCYALDKPLILDNRLTILAYQAYSKYLKDFGRYVSLLIAREKEYFISVYDNDFICVIPPQHITDDVFEAFQNIDDYIITDASLDIFSAKINEASIKMDIKIDLSVWAKFSFHQYNCNANVNLSTAEPFYLKQVYTRK